MAEPKDVSAKSDRKFENVRSMLGLTAWELHLAANTGVLPRGTDGVFEQVPLEQALVDPVAWRKKLRAEELIDGNQAAFLLHLPRKAIEELVEAGVIHVHSTRPFKYGKVKLYRTGDLEALTDPLTIWKAERALRTAAKRAEGAKRAIATKAANAEKSNKVLVETRRSLVTLSALPETQSKIGLVGFWLDMVSTYADYYAQAAQRARTNRAKLDAAADVCFKTKHKALGKLIELNPPALKMALLEYPTLYLCRECKTSASECGIRWSDWEGCGRDTVNHDLSIVEATIRLPGYSWTCYLPVPAAQSINVNSSLKEPVTKRYHGAGTERLPRWISQLRRYELNYYNAPAYVDPILLKTYPVEDVCLALDGALDGLLH